MVESAFSLIKNQKSQCRTSLPDEAATVALQCQHYPDVVGSTASSTTQPLTLDPIDMNECFEYDYVCHHGGSIQADETGSELDSDSD